MDGLAQTEKYALIQAMEKKYHQNVDMSYIKTVLFPEMFGADIPQPMSNLSYSRFTDRTDCTLNTGGVIGSSSASFSGNGLIIWYPRVTTGPSLFYYKGGNSSTPSIPVSTSIPFLTPTVAPDVGLNFLNGTETTAQAGWRAGFIKNYQDCFTQTALVAASISVQFVGQADSESGFMVGGHIYGQSPGSLTVDDIENSQYLTKARPSEGLRFTYIPMEASDYEFYPTSKDNAHNAGAFPTGNEQTFWAALKGSTLPAYAIKQLDGSAFSASTDTSILSMSDRVQYATNTNFVAIYWKGLPANSEWLRIDVTRRFNGIPKQTLRDYVDLTRSSKNFDAKKSFDVLRNLARNAPIGGHTLKELDRTQDRIQASLPNIMTGNMSERIDGLQSLADLAGVLEAPLSEEKGLIGNIGMAGRLYGI